MPFQITPPGSRMVQHTFGYLITYDPYCTVAYTWY